MNATLPCVLAAFLVLLPMRAAGQDCLSGGGFELCWSTIDAGGSTSTGGGFEMTGTIGQPDVGPVLTGGGFELRGGFWACMTALCPEDLNGDCIVNSADLTLLLGCWASGNPCGDIDGDGDSDSADLTLLLGAWGAGGCP